MEFLLIKGIKEGNFESGDVTTLNKILDFMWETLSDTEAQQFGKKFYKEVNQGKYSDYIRLDRKDDNDRAFYKIV